MTDDEFKKKGRNGLACPVITLKIIGVTHAQESGRPTISETGKIEICISFLHLSCGVIGQLCFENFWYQRELKAAFYSVQVSDSSFWYQILERVTP